MQTALLGAALVMGLAGGPHCVAMCGAPCAGVIRIARAPEGSAAALTGADVRGQAATLAFHAGRVLSYAAAGAIAAVAMQGVGFASERLAAMRPFWVLLHVAVLAWGLSLAVLGRQPVWAHRAGRTLQARLRPLTGSPAGVLATGALWALMPCGLLYSALMLAALADGPVQGAMMMAGFAAGSGVSLIAAPWLWQRMSAGAGVARKEWGSRVAGALLAAVAFHALWADLGRQIELWCR
ncbi:sulfite exporter TauE/SafE family protein [Variovorax ureilyticus]|uniref:sulfite exporter TauE/SafE family protein n=1 Tax=Variovorax ureilyticus TaxID=1836198 RepID=UPI003D67DD19